MEKPIKPVNNNTSDKKTSNWIIYSGMVFEMFAIIGIFGAIGYFLDKKTSNKSCFINYNAPVRS
jgi:hypothetical protein